jgi:xanthine dehydrogenase molybdopterin-binding subunit B
VKFGISFTATWYNQGGALVHVYTDGSVQLNHGGTERGQGSTPRSRRCWPTRSRSTSTASA